MGTGDELDRTAEFSIEVINDGLENEKAKEADANSTAPASEMPASTTPATEAKEDGVEKKFLDRVWTWIRPRFWMILGVKILFSGFILFAWWLSGVIEKMVLTVGSIPSSFWLWVLGIAVAIVVIMALWKNRSTMLAPLAQVRRKIIKWVIATVVIIGVPALIYKDYLQDKENVGLGELPVLAMGKPVSGEATLAMIAECESGSRQFDEEGALIVHSESGAIGKYQILPSWHEEDAEKLGLDIRTEEGNEAFAKVLFEKFGTEPWEASRRCWGDKVSAPYAETFSGETIATGFVRIGRNWSEWVRVPAGQELFFERTENVAYEVELQNGDTFKFSRDFRGHKRFPLIQSIRFRVTDEEAKELSVWLRFSPFQIT